MGTLASLSKDALFIVLEGLGLKDLFRCRKTCRIMRQLVDEYRKQLYAVCISIMRLGMTSGSDGYRRLVRIPQHRDVRFEVDCPLDIGSGPMMIVIRGAHPKRWPIVSTAYDLEEMVVFWRETIEEDALSEINAETLLFTMTNANGMRWLVEKLDSCIGSRVALTRITVPYLSPK